MNSREKGKRGERDVVALLRSMGLEARRGQQYKGGADSPDVVCPDLPYVHIEVKFSERLRLYEWLEQASDDRGAGQCGVVFYRRKGKPWVVIMSAEAFIETEMGYTEWASLQ